MSAVRLAAEAAFATPQSLHPLAAQAQVTVRKTRLALPAARPAVADLGPHGAEAAGKVPRVFRVDALPATNEAATHASENPADETALSTAAATGDDEAAAKAMSRTRRVTVDRRPGPVLHVIHALPEREAIEETGSRPDALLAELASVGPILDAIRRAQSFEIVDPRAAEEWTRLRQVAEDIGRQLEALCRDEPSGPQPAATTGQSRFAHDGLDAFDALVAERPGAGHPAGPAPARDAVPRGSKLVRTAS
jgi:hypothetical protein